MALDYRSCAGVQHLNTGQSKCALDPDKIKGIILVQHGYKLPSPLTAESLKAACHANRPERILPIKDIVEYAKSGGEAQVSATGYGPNKVTGYSARTDSFTVENPDLGLRTNLANAKNIIFDMYPYDANNIIYGVDDGTDQLAGIELSGVYPGGQDWDSSGTAANLVVNTMFKDAEKYLKTANVIAADFNVDDALVGLVYVDLKKMSGSSSEYKLIEHFGNLDITSYYGQALASAASEAITGISAAQYKANTETLNLTGTITGYALPSTLLTKNIEGIEFYV